MKSNFLFITDIEFDFASVWNFLFHEGVRRICFWLNSNMSKDINFCFLSNSVSDLILLRFTIFPQIQAGLEFFRSHWSHFWWLFKLSIKQAGVIKFRLFDDGLLVQLHVELSQSVLWGHLGGMVGVKGTS